MTSPSQETHIFVGHDLIRQAEARVRPFIRETGVERAPLLESGDGAVWLKLESQQVTGSFKVRGALNALMTLSEESHYSIERVVTASAGNHGLGVAFASQITGFPATIFVPESVDPARKRALEQFPIEVKVVRGGYDDAERAALEASRAETTRFVSSYNDPLVIAGQGTVACELARQVSDAEAVIVGVGGGGLLAGVGAYARAVNPDIEIIGVSPARSAAMCDILSGRPIPSCGHEGTLSDSTAGGIQDQSITIGLCRALINSWVLLTEEEIRAAMQYLFYEHRLVCEGAGALAVGAYMKERERLKDKNCVLVVCGSNISPEKFLSVIKRS